MAGLYQHFLCKVSDEKIGEALIKKVIEEETKDILPEDDPSLPRPIIHNAVELMTEQEKELVNKLLALVREVGEKVKDDKEVQDAIDELVRNFHMGGIAKANKTFNEMFQDGITWKKILIFVYVVGKFAGKIVRDLPTRAWNPAHLRMNVHHVVKEILSWAVDFFKKNLLGWIREQGGWSRCLAVMSPQRRGGLHH